MGEKRRDSWTCKNCNSRGKPVKNKDTVPQELIAKLQEEFLKKMEQTIKKQFSEYEAVHKRQFDEFKTSLEFFSKKIDDYDSEVKELKKTVKMLEQTNQSLQDNSTSLSRELSEFKSDFEHLQQYNRNRNIQIEGIPEVNGESMGSIVKQLSEVIDEPINYELDIQAMHRIPTKRNTGPKPIILQFTDRKKRDSVLLKSKMASKRKGIISTNFVRNAPKTNVYVNEHLTPYFKNLFYQSKRLRGTGYRFVWLAEGKIFVKKSETDRKIRIMGMEDLIKLGLDAV